MPSPLCSMTDCAISACKAWTEGGELDQESVAMDAHCGVLEGVPDMTWSDLSDHGLNAGWKKQDFTEVPASEDALERPEKQPSDVALFREGSPAMSGPSCFVGEARGAGCPVNSWAIWKIARSNIGCNSANAASTADRAACPAATATGPPAKLGEDTSLPSSSSDFNNEPCRLNPDGSSDFTEEHCRLNNDGSSDFSSEPCRLSDPDSCNEP
mmetsp:Transcript_114322/g.330255  ORF Transcript_114322/g.330255 Transcript_114322/m.330255 type:complete len:212 (-) Transcript_114322:25-660(-)